MTQISTMQTYQKMQITSVTCDGCDWNVASDWRPEGWHHFSSNHGDWGADSIDSYEYYDVCSFACYVKVLQRVWEDYTPPTGRRPSETLEIDGKDWWFIHKMMQALELVGE